MVVAHGNAGPATLLSAWQQRHAAVLERFVEAVAADHLGAHGVHVRVGNAEAENRWRSDNRENIYSVSKGVCALAAGFAIEAGIVSLDSRAAEMLSGIEHGPGVESVTLEHLLSMRSGIDFRWFGHEPVPGTGLAQDMLGRPTAGRRRESRAMVALSARSASFASDLGVRVAGAKQDCGCLGLGRGRESEEHH